MARKKIRTVELDLLRTPDNPGVDVHRIVDHGYSAAHDHLFHELVYIQAGTAYHETSAGMQKLRPGDVIVIRPQTWHGYQQPRRLTLINCLIDTKLIRRFRSLLSEVPAIVDLLLVRPSQPALAAPVVLHARPVQGRTICDRLDTIMAEQRRRAPGWRAAVTLAALDVLVITARIGSESDQVAPPISPIASSRVAQAVLDAAGFIEGHFSDAIHLTDLAGRVHLSPAHLSRNFARRMGMGVIEFMHRLRAEEACRLLQTTDRDIASIAAAVGYDEVAYFSRCFRKQIGLSPRDYRKQRTA